MSSPEEPTSETETFQELIARLTTTARDALTEAEVLTIPQPDGTSIRGVNTPIKSTTNLSVGLSEVTPKDGGPKVYSFSYVTRKGPLDAQVLTWAAGGNTITHSIRSTLFPEGPLQVIEEIVPTQGNVGSLEFRIWHLMGNYNLNTKPLLGLDARQRGGIRQLLGRLAGGGSGTGKQAK